MVLKFIPNPKKVVVSIVFFLLLAGSHTAAQSHFETVNIFSAQEAHQAVAVDSGHFYAIASTAIGKYDKQTGAAVQRWEAGEGSGITHLDSGVIVDGRLYAAHSNYPEIPMTSSVEIWDAASMEHIGSHSFGILRGSLTWIDRHGGYWWGVFAHYEEFKEQTGKDNRWTSLVKFDDDWQPLASWVFPEKVLDRFGTKSNSGGSWGPAGRLYISGHDLPELYVMQLPESGSVLQLIDIQPIENEGQGIAWDRSETGTDIIYTIKRSSREVVISEWGE